jgi:hypothetical protein
MTRQRIFRKIGIVGAVILPAWFYWGYLESVYVTWPTQPQPEMRRIVPYVVEGVEIYITPDDQQLNRELKWTIIGSGTILMVGLIFSGGGWFS